MWVNRCLVVCAVVASLSGCGNGPTLVRVEINAPGLSVASLVMTVDWSGHSPVSMTIPETGGAPTLPGSVLVELPDESTEISIGLAAIASVQSGTGGDAQTLSMSTVVQSRAHHEVDILMVLGSSLDGGVPDLAMHDMASHDLAVPDLASHDLATHDMAVHDMASHDLAHPVDLLPPRDLAFEVPLVQLGPVTDGNSTLTAALNKASGVGTLLVFTMTFDKNADPVGPSGWTRFSGYSTSNDAELWYLANNPGGITTATATLAGADVSVGQLSEWKSVTTLDQGAWCWQSAATTSLTCTTQPTTHAAELGLSCFSQLLPSPTPAPIAPGSAWTVLGDDSNKSRKLHYQFSYRVPLPDAMPLFETATSPLAGPWASVVTTFY